MRPIFFLILFFPAPLFAQNLVANGSFEDENICTEYLKNCSPQGWMVSSLQSHFYFDDAPNAYDGQHFVGLVAGGNGRYGSRNFISSQLLCGLRKNAFYRIVFFVREGIGNLDSAGVVFTPDNLLYRKWGMKDVVPSLWIKEQLQSTQNEKWQKYSGLYQANGDEAFIAVALFKTTKPERVKSQAEPDFYFYIDNLSVVPVDPNEKLCASATEVKEALYATHERHGLLEKKIYPLQRKEPLKVQLPKTVLQKIDTLIIPDVLFATDKYNLNKQANDVLDSFIKSNVNSQIDSIVVEGHTDSTGSIVHNRQLSKHRALTVAAYLQNSFAATIINRGFASEKPVADNRTAMGRQKNRRVEIYLYIRQ